MISRIFFVLAFFLPCLAVGNENFKRYNYLVNKGEIQIVSGNYNEAFKNYQEAFKNRPYPFAVDYYNAAVCAIKTNKLKTALDYCRRLNLKGLGADFFENKKAFDVLSKLPEWQAFINSADLKKQQLNLRHASLIKKLDSLFKADQSMNERWRLSGMNPDTAILMEKTNVSISRCLLGIIKKNGYPTEEEVGVRVTKDGEIDKAFAFEVIIIHNYESANRTFFFNGVLKNALIKGKIRPEKYAFLNDFTGGVIEGQYFGSQHYFVRYQCQLLRNKEMDTGQLTLLRRQVDLCSMSDFIEKLMYNIQNPYSDFQLDAWCVRYMNFKDPESERMFKEANTVVVDHIPNCSN